MSQHSAPKKDRVLSRAQIVRQIERHAQARRGVSAAELVRTYKDGTLPEPCEVMDILGLAFLLPRNDPLHAPLDEQPA
jgi:hypothetical protein